MTAKNNDSDMTFLEEDAPGTAKQPSRSRVKILIVDDDADVHSTTTQVLRDCFPPEDKPTFLSAYNSAEAYDILKKEKGIGVVFLDVVMETQDAGLNLVKTIRKDLNLKHTQILLRTGQPGNASEFDAITGYDINGYLLKIDLTPNKLFAALTTALRAYDLLCKEDAMHTAIEHLLSATSSYLGVASTEDYTLDTIARASSLLNTLPRGFLLSRKDQDSPFEVTVATPNMAHLKGMKLVDIKDSTLEDRLERCLAQHESIVDEKAATLFIQGARYPDSVLHVERETADTVVDLRMLAILKNAYATGVENMSLLAEVFRMSFEDSQLGIPNRQAFVQEISHQVKQDVVPAGLTAAIVAMDDGPSGESLLDGDEGAAALAAFSQRLVETFPNALVARVGNTKFGVMGQAAELTEKAFIGAFASPLTVNGKAAPFSLSVGLVAMAREGAHAGEDVIRHANTACKQAKKQGGGRCVFSSAK